MKSLDKKALDAKAKEIMKTAEEKGVQFLLPVDFVETPEFNDVVNYRYTKDANIYDVIYNLLNKQEGNMKKGISLIILVVAVMVIGILMQNEIHEKLFDYVR